MRSNISVKYISISILLLILLFSSTHIVQGAELDIFISDLSNQEISEINENEHFKISVLDFDQIETPYLTNVNLEFYGLPYTIGESAEFILQAPEVDSDRTITIYASKAGYNSTNKTITILNNESQDEILLVITPEAYTVNAGETFSILVTDEDGNNIAEAIVAIQSFGDTKTTDDDGRAWLTAPEEKQSITIIAQKEGYASADIEIMVNIPETWWMTFIKSPYFPIIIAIIFLLFAIIFVNSRQKKSVYNRASEISQEKTLEKYNLDEKSNPSGSDNNLEDPSSIKEPIRTKPEEDPKVEEIRISRPRKEKEIVDVDTEEDETEKVIKKKQLQKRDYDWFEGTDDMRYEIDKLTGEIDEETKDKWFEGVDQLKDKVDEKVKKKDKKKDEEK